MNYVELHRHFVRLEEDEEPMLNIGIWGRRIAGWLGWNELLEFRRVVLLAEASSGKSEEFRHQQQVLSTQGKPAFFIRIEELADQGFEGALEPEHAEDFLTWRSGAEHAYFFLDSVDEARLNRKSFETALRRFARELDRAVERTFVFISCRATDWKVLDDRRAVERLLPWRETAAEVSKDVDPLLDPVFGEQTQNWTRQTDTPQGKPGDLLVVQLVPLSNEQCRDLARAAGVAHPVAFMDAVTRGGLDAFTERPGDVIDLATYWNARGRFDSLAEMVEHNISRKLAEADAYRPDNDALTPEKARRGAERVAAALTLGKSFTLRAPGHDPDPSLAAGALDPSSILQNWNDAERNALLRRGIFAPSTYGRIRFHHRTTQEYLTAQWLDELLRAGCPRDDVWSLMFAERYGVSTVVPSLRPAAAWLAYRHLEIREEILRREPLILVRYGDPRSLPIEFKKRLLLAYARMHAEANISDDIIDHRAIWLFSEPGLAKTIREAWHINSRPDFRIDLLRIIREGPVPDCADLARKVVLDRGAGDRQRIVAAEALVEYDDTEGLSKLSRHLMRNRARVSPRLASEFAKLLFPLHLSVGQLLRLIDLLPEMSGRSGFPDSLLDLYERCGDASTRKALVSGLAELCLAKPFAATWERVSKRHVELAQHLAPIAQREVESLRGCSAPAHVVRLLMAVERSDEAAGADDGPALANLVQQNRKLNRELFWADVCEVRQNYEVADKRPARFWQIRVRRTLWKFDAGDLPKLFRDLADRTQEDDRRIALSAIVSIVSKEGRLEVELPRIRDLVAAEPVLLEDLDAYLAPPAEDEYAREDRKRSAEIRLKRDKEESDAKQSWVKFREYVRTHFNELHNPDLLASWKKGAFRLQILTDWLIRRTNASDESAARQWRLLEEGFGRDVAEAYRDGMKVLWRVTKPERPKRKDGGGITIKHTTILAYQGIGVEAAEDPDWTLSLTDAEVKIAARHGCLSEQGYPEWFDALIASHPRIVVPLVKSILKQEWEARGHDRTDFLYRFSIPGAGLQPGLHKILFELISCSEPQELSTLDKGLRILPRLELTPDQKRQLARTVDGRFHEHERTGKMDWAMRYLTFSLLLNPDEAITALSQWLARPKGRERRARAEETFAQLFGRNDPSALTILSEASTATLEQLLRFAYRYVNPKDDQHHEGTYTANTRDNAEGARNTILSAVLNRPGIEGYKVLLRLSEERTFFVSKERLRELAREKAERDSELEAWTEQEVVAFEEHHAAPVKSGSDLLRIVMGVLADIQFQLEKGDVTSRPLLQRAKDEDEVRNWLVEQMKFRAQGRFHAYREAEVADNDRPDIIVASTTASCEVGVEVKHGGKKWTKRQLELALRVQLATNYLKPASRRHGVFVITNHGLRRWRDAETNQLLNFKKLVEWLTVLAESIAENDSGLIQLRCFGLDATGNNG